MPLLSVKDLHVSFNTPYGDSHTLRGVDFATQQGPTFGIVAAIDLMGSTKQSANLKVEFEGNHHYDD